MKFRSVLKIRRFFRRFNLWLFLGCVLLAALIWCVTLYLNDPNGLRETADAAVAAAVTVSGAV